MKLGVITATLNSAAHLARAMAGLPASVEHLVIDGGSTDATEEIARARSGTRFIAMPGSSIYEAWNAGLRASTADVVCFVNSDDEVRWHAPEEVLACFAATRELEIVNGGFRYVDDSGCDAAGLPPARAAAPLTLDTVLFDVCAINARWFRRSLFERLGGFDAGYALAADREWLLRCMLHEPRQAVAAGLTYAYRIHLGSQTLDATRRNALRIGVEHMAMAEAYLAHDALPARDALQRFHAAATLTAAAAAWRTRRLGALAGICAKALRKQPSWPLHVPAVLAARRRRLRLRRGADA